MGPDPSTEHRAFQQDSEARRGYKASVEGLEEGNLQSHSNFAITSTVIFLTCILTVVATTTNAAFEPTEPQ